MDSIDVPIEDPKSRTIEVNMGGGELVEFELSQLAEGEDGVEPILDIFESANAKVELWLICILEFIRIGNEVQAERMAELGLKTKRASNELAAQVPLLLVLANMKLAKAKKAPKLILPNADGDILPPSTLTKGALYEQASEKINEAQRIQMQLGENFDMVGFLSVGIMQLARGEADGALKHFDSISQREPNNVFALLGKARVAYTQRDPQQALVLFQKVLSLNPDCKPDPRIGIGLCYWVLNSREKAKAAWTRSLELDPNSWAAELLLGLERLNVVKNVHTRREDRDQPLIEGLRSVAAAFRASDQTSAAAAIASSTMHSLESGAYSRAVKLAERAMQFADTRAHYIGGLTTLARIHHMQGNIPEAQGMFEQAASESRNSSLLADIGAGQMQIASGDLLQAKHTFGGIIKRWPHEPEVQAIYASLLAHPHAGLSAEEEKAERAQARVAFDRIQHTIDNTSADSIRDISDDPDLFVEMAKTWHGNSIEKAAKAYRSAAEVRLKNEQPKSPQLLNNLASLAYLDGDLQTAETIYQEALTSSVGMEGSDVNDMKTTILYNLGRAYEGQGKLDEAKEAYRQILAIHPEYPDAKVRLAAMCIAVSQFDEANTYLKEALTAHPTNLELRAFYLYFLVQTTSTGSSSAASKAALDFAYTTLKEHRSDVYSLCAAGWLVYRTARETKPSPRDAQNEQAMKTFRREQSKNFLRSAEFFDKALSVDPECSFAAQSLAIAIAENALAPAGSSNEDGRTRVANARQALSVFHRVRETLTDGSVYINMGHCYFANDEFERAIESYETGLQRFYNGVHSPILLYLARTWYAKANREGNFSAMQIALRYLQKAVHIQPHDKAILFNVAMIEQKAAEMLIALPTDQRTLAELQDGLKQAVHAQKIFLALASDKSKNLPYNPEMADQRYRYGSSIIRRGPAEVEKQTAYEQDAQATVAAAMQRREEEKQKLEAKEKERAEEIRRQAEALAEERRLAREQVASWVFVQPDYEPEREKKVAKKRKKKAFLNGSDDEGGQGMSSGEEREEHQPRVKKSKKSKKQKKFVDPDEMPDDAEAHSNDEDDEESRPKKSKPRKKVVAAAMSDDEDALKLKNKKGKRVISKETISDSDED
ncbi:TPR-containing nuclear phosphoprotein that regulates K() uptake [Phaffia rhodozyma]|uniref:TPR-containing nuclear phosphoprotein that regulates K( ) uptake n=1 Tax=Phaffia rhodozyma TaxID=264483 RepID=A0A0F7SEY4_PHARH|nr:TPR-containing nuclear phosphoprotein that regulates K() uptake [Phaffia rhodozyma]